MGYMLYLTFIVFVVVSVKQVFAHTHEHVHAHAASLQNIVALPNLAINSVPVAVQEHWIRRAKAALTELVSPCSFSAFATVIVNHTSSTAGEIAAIQNCTAVLTDPHGPHKLTPSQAQAAFADLSLYTNAESCPMCASAIRWAGFREYVYGTSIETLILLGWAQIRIPSIEVFRQSFDLPHSARLMGGVLANETDPLFSWQFNPEFPCPAGCARQNGSTTCRPV
ncbi:hypothetical protein BN946_scf185043.g185 [Trametes cinnabarina]|uniref:CMP/dCMP-type deaminase domain-containing protein n=1 Tax=Pycnoporus cinnabarinus TaxID=5643 RepID=A0A060SI99_PYCCI|nr:hypothetical protein BN946_scf185043.g185 [Trametes cinnabarina]